MYIKQNKKRAESVCTSNGITHTQMRVTQQSGEVNDYFYLSPHTHTLEGSQCFYWSSFIWLRFTGGDGLFYDLPALLSADGTRTWTERAARLLEDMPWGQGSEVRGLNQWWRQHTTRVMLTLQIPETQVCKNIDAKNYLRKKKKWYFW